MGSSSGNTRTTTTNEPPAFIQPYMQYGAQQAYAQYQNGGPQYYPGNTVVPFSSQTEQALGLTEQRALNGSDVNNAAQDYAARTLNTTPTSQFGSGANPYGSVNNPYLDATFNKAADSVQQRLGSQFAGAGRNTDASRAVNADELTNLSNAVYGGAYENERNRGFAYEQAERDRMAQDLDRQRSMQFGVAGLAPQLANQDYVDLQALGGVGGQVEDLAGRLMEDQAARWDFDQNASQTNLDNYLARITGAYPGATSTQTTPTYRNRTAGAAGGAMAGAQLGSQIYPGWGTAIGAVAGGLLGGWG